MPGQHPCSACVLPAPPPVMSQAVPRCLAELKELTREHLMSIEVTFVSRAEETLGGAAATLAVVTGEDIRRSGATSVPDALKTVPGLHVAQQTASTWQSHRAVSAASTRRSWSC